MAQQQVADSFYHSMSCRLCLFVVGALEDQVDGIAFISMPAFMGASLSCLETSASNFALSLTPDRSHLCLQPACNHLCSLIFCVHDVHRVDMHALNLTAVLLLL